MANVIFPALICYAWKNRLGISKLKIGIANLATPSKLKWTQYVCYTLYSLDKHKAIISIILRHMAPNAMCELVA